MVRTTFTIVTAALVFAVAPLAAKADEPKAEGPVSVVRAQFTDRVEGSKPVGDAASLAGARTATYWVDVKSTKDATSITLVWKVDGQEAGRQSLDVGHSPHWKTWGSWPIKKAHTVAVQVLDAEGNAIHDESVDIAQ